MLQESKRRALGSSSRHCAMQYTFHDMQPHARDDIRLRKASPKDATLLSRLAATLFAQTFAESNTPQDMATYLDQTFRVELQEAELADPACVTWLAEDARGNAVGYAMLWQGSRIESVQAKHPAEIQRIYADRSMHGRGVGAALMRACVDQARAWGCDVLWLAVWEKNARAIAFYEKMGFRRVGATTFQLGSDRQRDDVMARTLTDEA